MTKPSASSSHKDRQQQQNKTTVLPIKKQVDYTKIYSNGHKSLNASQAKSLVELMKQEDDKRLNFKQNATLMVMPRNPLIGESTPRQEDGSVIMNPNSLKLLGTYINCIHRFVYLHICI